MQLKRVTNKHSHQIFSECERGPGGSAPSRWAIFAILQQRNSDFKAILITFSTFLKPHE